MVVKRRSFARARKAAGYTQESLAERLGIDRTTVARWEAGQTAPQPWARPKIAETFGLSLDELNRLLGDTGTAEQVVDIPEPRTEALALPEDFRVFFDELGVTASASGITWEAYMACLTRRLLLKQGIVATALPILGASSPAVSSRPVLSAPSVASWANAIYEAVLRPTDAVRSAATLDTAPEADQMKDVHRLRHATDRVMQVSLSSDYDQLAQELPRLIGQAERASLTAHDADCVPLYRVLSDIYATAGWTLIKADSPAAAWIAAQRAMQAAEKIDDTLRAAAATRCLSEVHMRARTYEEASRTAFLAATYLDTARAQDAPTILCLRGAALLSAAAAAARRGDGREAYTALKAAAACGTELNQDRADLATVFGPTNVAIHQVAVAVELGNAREALRHIPMVKLNQMPKQLTERRARFLIDVARSHAQLQNDSAALDALLEAEQIAPDELRHHRLTHGVVRDLLSRERRSSGLRALADRCMVLN
jgi:transcriptional regulator with XRE-family HTH domain